MKKAIIAIITSLLLVSITFTTRASEADKNWPELLEQAKSEGEITFSVWYFQSQWRNVVKSFEQQYGIKVRIPEGTLDGNVNKLLAEAKRKKGKIDVIAISVNQLPAIKGVNALQKIDWLPEYKNAYHSIQNIDSDGYGVAYWGNQTGFAYDPQRMDNHSLPQTLEDLQGFIDANPKKFGYNDPANGGAGTAFIERVVFEKSGAFDITAKHIDPQVVKSWQKGWQWFSSNKTKITYTASGADSLTRLNDGELMLTPAWQDHLESLQKSGAITSRLKFYIPEFGMPGGGNIAGIAANSPHPAASAVFINWLIQPETQKELQKMFSTRPMNKLLADESGSIKSSVEFYSEAYATAVKKEFITNVVLKK